jgi:hypothetical protein
LTDHKDIVGAALMTDIFPLLILNARPGAGKSELIHGLQALPADVRKARFHLGRLTILDDFPMLWSWFEEDHILETQLDRPRLHTTPDEYFLHEDLWHLLIHRLSLEYEKWLREPTPDTSVVIEFSRGGQHGGYRAAYQHLSDQVLQRAACLYLQVSYQESLRKNKARFNPDRPDSILEHGLSEEKMEVLYRQDDWSEFSQEDPAYLHVRQMKVPYVVYPNEDDLTSAAAEPMLARLEPLLSSLWQHWSAIH